MTLSFYKIHGDDEIAVCKAGAEDEQAGGIPRESNERGKSVESYDRRLWKTAKPKAGSHEASPSACVQSTISRR